ncbi:magnesium transporter CorA family protein [Rhizobium sp. SSA_523]|uniref:magnesium transporter CorA family protein n=1 Tax=Rhizobium sp. SSA_523 TaxID=2952477 RepID=UPI002090F5A5|nr:magnesium transporter CorA family protein [Rhizobium sp. SSA_523]MCO5731125.1 magnesium transporter CorA family protein [Rhizobium sp. SSA_523]WKC24078.1 magnesium transporter CorA family protein [Rhizobium sp. SSA_523]
MITAYRANGSNAILTPDPSLAALDEHIVWLDLLNPTTEEDHFVERLLGISVPTRDDLKDIEPSSRLYMENAGVFMTASLVWRADTDDPQLTDVAFILTQQRLLTVRYAEPKSFHLFAAAFGRVPDDIANGCLVLAHLLETIADRTAEILETAVARIDGLSTEIFRDRGKRRPPKFLESKLADIAECHRLIGKVRDSLGSLSRLLTFLLNTPIVSERKETTKLCKTVARDVSTLSEHANFVAGNISFLLDASLGLINVEQNAIIKIFSIASVVFLPPTLVASIYGMNFAHMPELGWHLGYPMALVTMVISAVVPFYFFRWKGWL